MMRLLATAACLAMLTAPSRANDSLPAPVVRFLEKRAVCDGWRYEPHLSGDRTAVVSAILCAYCPGTDAELAALKRQYGQDARVSAELAPLEEGIEPGLLNGKLACPATPVAGQAQN